MQTARPITRITDYDITLFQAGHHCRLYEKFGAHPAELDGEPGIAFAVYAPAARAVSVIGSFNRWQAGIHALFPRWDNSGVWEGFIPGLEKGDLYKYAIESYKGWQGTKADPYGRKHETPPNTATYVWTDDYAWQDAEWMRGRHARNRTGAPMSIYEMHLASWRKKEDGTAYTYLELADFLPAYLKDLGFTHVEFMPVMEHPYDPSWGYQITGYFASTSRFGSPEDLKHLIDALHRHGIGVILDWVPSHFPTDGHGLGFFDGSHVYEHPDPQKGFHPDWQSLIFNYGRYEVKSFLISNALFWIDEFHADGLRVDAVASMIYLDYSRKEGEWSPNMYGGREYIEAIEFLKMMNETVYRYHPDIITIAEESTSFTGVSHPTYNGGLGFGMKWMMGWMHDTLKYFQQDPLYRKHHHTQITFSMIYNYSENYVLPFSHDEVVHGKGSLLSRMPGKGQDQFAHLRLMLAYMYTHPGAKLLFMGGEFGQRSEWNFAGQLEWDVLGYESHLGIHSWVKTLNHLYTGESALYELCTRPDGFRWLRVDDWQQSILAYERIGEDPDNMILTILNLTPVDRPEYRIGTYAEGKWTLLHNSDDLQYWGKGRDVLDTVVTEEVPWEHKPNSMLFTLPGLTALVYKWTPAPTRKHRGTAKALKPKQKAEEAAVVPVSKKKPVPRVEAVPPMQSKKKAGKGTPVPTRPTTVGTTKPDAEKKKQTESVAVSGKGKAGKAKTQPVLPPPQSARPMKPEAAKKASAKKHPAARTPDRKVTTVTSTSKQPAKSTAPTTGKPPAKKAAVKTKSPTPLPKSSPKAVKAAKKKK
jgi:1,4-alpha-glucan branching enzyme